MIEPSEMKDYNLNKVKYGVNVSICNNKLGGGLSFTYYVTPFFQEGQGPDIQEYRICFTSSVASISEQIAKEKAKH